MANYKKASTKVVKKVTIPKTTSGSSLFPKTRKEYPRAPQSRIYTKDTLRQDPTEFGEFGFGLTGLTGES